MVPKPEKTLIAFNMGVGDRQQHIVEEVDGTQLQVEEVAADLLQPGDFVMANSK